MATIDLGRLGFVNKGTYNNSTTYEKNDLVQFTDGGILSTYLYIDSTAQSGQAPSSSGTVGSRWVFFAKGVTDSLGGISNNNIVIKDNSGNITGLSGNNKIITTNNSGVPTALSMGSAGQSLKVNSGANGFEFGTISSDYVKLASSDASGNPASIFFSDVFTSDYTTYKLFIDSAYSSTNSHPSLRFTSSGTTEISSGYYMAGPLSYYDYNSNGSANITHRRHHNDSGFKVLEENNGTSQVNSLWSEFTFLNPRQSSQYKLAIWNSAIRSTNNYFYTLHQHGYLTDTSNTMGGIRIYPSAGTWTGGQFTLYGIK